MNIKPLEAIGFDYYALEDSDVCTTKNVISRKSCTGALDRLRRAPIRGDRTRIPFDGEVMTKQIDEERKRERIYITHIQLRLVISARLAYTSILLTGP